MLRARSASASSLGSATAAAAWYRQLAICVALMSREASASASKSSRDASGQRGGSSRSQSRARPCRSGSVNSRTILVAASSSGERLCTTLSYGLYAATDRSTTPWKRRISKRSTCTPTDWATKQLGQPS
eukprot:4749656-Pleurochrysis_carterae.AAC.2